MNFYRKSSFFHIYLAWVALLIPVASVHAQSTQEQKPAPSSQEAEKQSDTKRSKDPVTVAQLNEKIDKLQTLIEQQQRLLGEIQRRLDEVDGTSRVIPVSSARSEGATELRTAAREAGPTQKNTTAASQAKDQDKPPAQVGWGKDHAFLRSADGAFETQIGGYGQLDFRGYQSGDHPPNSFFLRRARIALEGKLERYFDFRIEGDFADPVTPLRDFYVNIHRIDEFQLRFGQFRVPISQEEMRSDNFQDFVERSLVNNLVPSRSPGLGASGVINKGVFEYQLGAWNGKGLLAAEIYP